MYFPKSQIITNLSTNGSEFIVEDTGEYYNGSYFATSNGKFYTGNTPQDGNPLRLIKALNQTSKDSSTTPLSATKLTTESSPELSNSIYFPRGYHNSNKTLALPDPPKSSIVFPTEGEYETGEYQRYFLKHNTNNFYLEVTKHTYTNYVNKNSNTQYPLYTPIVINWILIGEPIKVYKVNRNIVLLYEKENNIRGFANYFKGRYLRYYRPLKNQYYSTKGGELKVENTNENYSGFYHVFPTRGVIMEGRFHTPNPHSILIPFESNEIVKSTTPIVSGEVGTSIRRNIQRESGY